VTRRRPPGPDVQRDLFAATFADIPIRDQRDLMERPFFSLAKRPRYAPIEYRVGETWVEVTANPTFGMATIWDADVLIWAATQVTEALDRGEPAGRTLSFHPYNLLTAVRRPTGGDHYKRLREALDRLTHTAVRTNIRADGKRRFASFHWLEGWTEVTDEATGESRGMTVTLPDWLYQGIAGRGMVLTIHEDYFKLTGGIERFLYRVARKHAGSQELGWRFTMRQLFEKSGSAARFSDFALDVRRAAEADHLPEYAVDLCRNDAGEEVVGFVRRSRLAFQDPRYRPERSPQRSLGRELLPA